MHTSRKHSIGRCGAKLNQRFLRRDMLRPANAFADILRDRSQFELETLEYVAHGGVEGKIILMTAGLAPM